MSEQQIERAADGSEGQGVDTTVDPDALDGLNRPITGEPGALPADAPQAGRTDAQAGIDNEVDQALTDETEGPLAGRGTGDMVHEQDLRT